MFKIQNRAITNKMNFDRVPLNPTCQGKKNKQNDGLKVGSETNFYMKSKLESSCRRLNSKQTRKWGQTKEVKWCT